MAKSKKPTPVPPHAARPTHRRRPTAAAPVSPRTQALLASLAGLALILVTALVAFRPISDSDYWHHLSLGRIVSTEQRFPAGDELSSTAEGRPWVSSGWLPSVLLYKLSQFNGGAQVYVTSVALASMLLLLAVTWRRSRENIAIAIALLILMALAAYPRFLPRPDMFSMALIIPLILLLSWYQRHPLGAQFQGYFRIFPALALFLVWGNCHMLFVIGLFITGLFAAGEIVKNRGFSGYAWHRPVGILLGCIGITHAYPYGVQRTWWFIKENASLQDVSHRINELKPLLPIVSEPGGKVMLFMLLLWFAPCAWLLFLQYKQGKLSLWRWLTAAFLLVLVLVQRRHIGLAVFGITALTVDGLRGLALPAWVRGRWVAGIAPVLGVGVLALGLSGRLPMVPAWSQSASRTDINREWLPDEAIGFLRQNPPPGRMFHDLYTGGFLGYHLAPSTRVFIDGRLEVYNNGTFDDFFAPTEGRATIADLFGKYSVESALLDWRSAADQPGQTAAALSDSPDWQLCWFSDHYALFVRRGHPYAQQHGYTYLNPLRPQAFMQALANPATISGARAEAHRAQRENPGGMLARRAVQEGGG